MSRPGWLEVEFAGQRSGGNHTDRRDNLPYLLKLALSENWRVLLSGDTQARLTPDVGTRLAGIGDTTATSKYRLPWDVERTAFGAEASVKLPTSKTGLGSGARDPSLKGIYSVDLDRDFHLNADLAGTRLGKVDPGQGRTQLAWATAVSNPLGDAWRVVVDLSGRWQRGAD